MDELLSQKFQLKGEETAPLAHRPIILNRRTSGSRRASDAVDTSAGELVVSQQRATPTTLQTISQERVCLHQGFTPGLSLKKAVHPYFPSLDVSQFIPDHKPPIAGKVLTTTGNAFTSHSACHQQLTCRENEGVVSASFSQQSCTSSCGSCFLCLDKDNAERGVNSSRVQDGLSDQSQNLRDRFTSALPAYASRDKKHASFNSPVFFNELNGGNKENVMNDSLTTITWLGQMDAQKLLPCSSVRPTTLRNLERGRPPYSYMALIQFAINSSPARRMTLKQIYCWIEETFPYFKHAKPGWKNSIRHNLSLHDIFIREVSTSSKFSYWTLRPDLNQRPLTLDYITRMNGNTFRQLQRFASTSTQEVNPSSFCCPEEVKPCVLMSLPMSNFTSTQPLSLEQVPLYHQWFPKQIKQEPLESDVQKCFQVEEPEMQLGNKCSNLSPVCAKVQLEEPDCIKEKKEDGGPGARKKRRKQPMRTLNDSLNDSLHFVDNSPMKSPKLLNRGSDEKEKDANNNVIKMPTKNDRIGHCEAANPFVASEIPVPNCEDSLSVKELYEAGATRTAVSGEESPLEECIPQIFGGDTFAFNSSFNKFLNASGINIFNTSDRSIHFSDFDDSNWTGTSDGIK